MLALKYASNVVAIGAYLVFMCYVSIRNSPRLLEFVRDFSRFLKHEEHGTVAEYFALD